MADTKTAKETLKKAEATAQEIVQEARDKAVKAASTASTAVSDTAKSAAKTVSTALSGAADKANKLAKQARKNMPELTTGQKVAVGVGVAAAVAGLVGAVKLARSRAANKKVVFHLVYKDDIWQLNLEGESGNKATFETKDEGVSAARELAASHAPSQLVIHRTDGTTQDRHSYSKDA